jgi:hypothetical protein
MSKKITSESASPRVLPQKENKTRPLESLREVVGLVSAGAGIFAALLYLAGRSYASGYFEAMNIPSYQVSFSMWEYGEVAWLPLLLYPIGMIVFTGLLMGILSRIFDFLSPMIQRFSVWLKAKIKIRLPSLNLPESSRETKFWFSIAKRAFSFLLLVGLAVFTLQFVYGFGQINGRLYIEQSAKPIEIISTVPLPLDDNTLLPVLSSGQEYYVDKDLHLLTINENRYFVFKDVDPSTKKPLKVYVIEGNQSLQINLLP